MNSNERLILDFQNNNESSLRPFYKQVKVKFLGMYRSKLDQDSLNDVYQEGFVRLYEAAIQGKLGHLSGDLEGYLLGICRHLVASQVKFLMKNRSEEWLPEIHGAQMEWEELGEPDIREKNLSNAFDQLGEQCQKILRAFYYLGWDMSRIAKEMNYSTTETVKSQKYRCMQHVKKLMKKDE